MLILTYCYLLNGQSLVRQFEDRDYILKISHWTNKGDFPITSVQDFFEDSRSYIWLASTSGLIRFDGRNTIIYSKKEGFRSNDVFRIAEDVNHNLWVLSKLEDSEVTVIDIFDPITEQVIPVESYIDIDEPLPLYDYYTNGFYRQQDTIWLFDANKGGRYTGKWEWLLNDTITSPSERDIYFPRKDSLFWAWGKNEYNYLKLRLIDRTGQEMPYLSFNHTGEHLPLMDEDFNLYFHQKKDLEATEYTIDSLFRFDDNGIKAFPFGEYPTVSWGNPLVHRPSLLMINKDDFAIFRGYRSLLFLKNKEALFTNLSTLFATEFNTKLYGPIFIAKDGAFWFATQAGFFRLQIKAKLFTTYPLEDKTLFSTRGIVGIGDSQVIANTYVGAFNIDLEDKSFSPLPMEDRFQNMGIYKKGNTVWVGRHNAGIRQYNVETKQDQEILPLTEKKFDGHVFLHLNDSILWVGSSRGLLELNESTQALDYFCLRDTVVYFLYANQQGIWAGSQFGLVQLDEQGQIKERFRIIENIEKGLKVFYIHEDTDGSFWLGTNHGLVHWQTDTHEYRQFRDEDGLSDNTIHAIYEDSYGYLWMPSNHGLMRFRKTDGYTITYLEKDGLPDSEFNFLSHYQRPDGLLFLGGMKGIVSFYPDSTDIPSQMTHVLQLDRVTAHNRETEGAINLSKEAIEKGVITIQPNENRLEINLMPHYLSEDRIIYEWRLPEEGEQWIKLREPYLQLNNLSYGDYPLEFRSYSLGNKDDDTSILSLQLHVVKPFYLRWWFIMLTALTLLLMIYLFFVWRQRQLLVQNRILQEEVNHQTQELQKKLTTIDQQARELKLIDKVKSRFFINISHELRTPLTLILGPVSNLIENPLTELKIRQNELKRIKRNTLHLQQLTEEILDLARLEADKLERIDHVIQLKSFVKRLYASYTSLADYREISYKLELSIPANLQVYIDEKKVERILNNFISNALKFTWAGGKVLVKVDTTDQEIRFAVQDTGIGISADDLPRIFDRYYQAGHQENLENGGLGIGLAMAKELGVLLGGKVWATSVLNKGTTLFLSLPLKPVVEVSEKVEQLEITTDVVKNTPTFKPIKQATTQKQPLLLLVEDNKDLLNYLTEMLSVNFRIAKARNGVEALAILKNRSIDLVISDVMMPKMDGFELLKQVRSKPQKWGVPFILLTARAEMSDQLHGLRLGVDAYLSKPFEQKELLARIYNLLENQKRRKSAIQLASMPKGADKTKENSFISASFDDVWLSKLEELLRKKLIDSNLKIIDLAAGMAMSERSFRTKLKYCTGLKPNQYILQARLQLAYHLLDQKQYSTIAEVTYAVGIQSNAYFSKVFKEKYGKSPSELLK